MLGDGVVADSLCPAIEFAKIVDGIDLIGMVR
jgi:hypothetical protein